ncbi:MAG: HNH endonuclease [Peptostreptococcaceae bacterium]
MNNKQGAIAITDYKWFDFLKKEKIEEVNFWTKSLKKTSLNQGDLLFFLKKNDKYERGERKLVGYGFFKMKENLTIQDTWERYNKSNGVESLEVFENRLNKVLKNKNALIGCIILYDLCYFEEPIYLSKIGVEFKKQVQVMKFITENDINKILDKNSINIDTVVDYDEDIEFKEGETVTSYNTRKKRNSIVRESKLKQYESVNGSVFCEVCGENDMHTIEVHHKFEVSKMDKGHRTKLGDLNVVCANCHKKLHGYSVTVEDLKKLF